MAIHSLKSIQKIPAALEKVWDFYSSHANVLLITPPNMKFKLISQNESEKLYTGQVIKYSLRPVLNIPLSWMTEIKNVKPPVYFMDEQRKGPYRIWQHQHFFKAIEGGTEMTDIALYQLPFGLFGEPANFIFVKQQLRSIFQHRFRKMEEIFGRWPGGQLPDVVIN